MLGLFKETPDQQLAYIAELETQKKKLQIELDTMHLDAKNKSLDLEMKLKEEAHKQKLDLMEEKAKFRRDQEIWKEEKEKLIAEHKKELVNFKEKIKADSDLEILKLTTMAKLDAEQQTKQAELDAQRQISELKVKHIEELAAAKTEANTKYYDKMTDAYQDMQANGDKNSKFVQELALKIFDQAPKNRTEFALEYNTKEKDVSAQ